MVRGADARRRERCSPEGIVQTFHVCLYKIEPRLGSFACNLLTNDEFRAALFDEPMERREKVPLVIKPAAFACRAERLARGTGRPDGTGVGEAGEAQAVGPDANPGEEVTLAIARKIGRKDIGDTPFINIARRYQALKDEVAQPLGRVGVKFVVVSSHAAGQSLV